MARRHANTGTCWCHGDGRVVCAAPAPYKIYFYRRRRGTTYPLTPSSQESRGFLQPKTSVRGLPVPKQNRCRVSSLISRVLKSQPYAGSGNVAGVHANGRVKKPRFQDTPDRFAAATPVKYLASKKYARVRDTDRVHTQKKMKAGAYAERCCLKRAGRMHSTQSCPTKQTPLRKTVTQYVCVQRPVAEDMKRSSVQVVPQRSKVKAGRYGCCSFNPCAPAVRVDDRCDASEKDTGAGRVRSEPFPLLLRPTPQPCSPELFGDRDLLRFSDQALVCAPLLRRAC